MEKLNTYCRSCSAYTSSKLVNCSRTQELECRCKICGEIKDCYSYGEPVADQTEEETSAKSKCVFKIIYFVGIALFTISAFALWIWNTKYEITAFVILVLSLVVTLSCAFIIEPKTTGVSPKELDAFDVKAKQLGEESLYAMSEAVESMTRLGEAGYNAEQVMRCFNNLATAGIHSDSNTAS